MAYKIADNILTPLGTTTDENYVALRCGRTALRRHTALWELPFSFTAALFTESQRKEMLAEKTFFESGVEQSVRAALAHTTINPSTDRVVFILSTTKGDIALLDSNDYDGPLISPSTTAQRIASTIGVRTTPIVVCNACISGVSAIILAQRLIEAHIYDYAIVVGAEITTPFVASGFHAFMILSEDSCRPFDIDRCGMNLGDAIATIILSAMPTADGQWQVVKGAVRNDAYHVSTPIKSGDGLVDAILAVLPHEVSTLAEVNVHGTATLFNDSMEAQALARTGLNKIPISALKGSIGHTMGAAGVVETLLTMRALDDGVILSSRGFSQLGVSRAIDISSSERSTDRHSFVKLLSGFGGTNAAILVEKTSAALSSSPRRRSLTATHHILVTPQSVLLDGEERCKRLSEGDFITQIYNEYVGDYPKFYKMDPLCRLAFIACELLVRSETMTTNESNHRAIAFFNHSSTIVTDKAYLSTISDTEHYYPSPSLFVYTLPNITTAEIAIRHGYKGETMFCLLPTKDPAMIQEILSTMPHDVATTSILGGWIEYLCDTDYEADISIYTIKE